MNSKSLNRIKIYECNLNIHSTPECKLYIKSALKTLRDPPEYYDLDREIERCKRNDKKDIPLRARWRELTFLKDEK